MIAAVAKGDRERDNPSKMMDTFICFIIITILPNICILSYYILKIYTINLKRQFLEIKDKQQWALRHTDITQLRGIPSSHIRVPGFEHHFHFLFPLMLPRQAADEGSSTRVPATTWEPRALGFGLSSHNQSWLLRAFRK